MIYQVQKDYLCKEYNFVRCFFAADCKRHVICTAGNCLYDRVLESKVLKQTTHYSIYLPPGYETSKLDYPVLYLLHGGGDNWKDWLLKGQAAAIADATINSGEAPSMIIVMPDGMQNWYNNNHDGSFLYEDYFFQELIPHIEATYRCRTEKQYRAISGLSMGGGAVYSIHSNILICSRLVMV
jgi:enterochelin esterase-like enzyme